MHSTVEVDGQEQNRFVDGSLFALCNDASVIIEDEKKGSEITAVHKGYQRLSDPVLHRRKIKNEKSHWIIEDEIIGESEHQLTWSFVCAPGVSLAKSGSTIQLKGSHSNLELSCSDSSLPFQLVDGEIAPGYGKRIPTQFIHASKSVKLPFKITFTLRKT
jgi:hypothetical protein